MKIALFAIGLILGGGLLSAQIEKKDNLVKVLAYWKKGDTATYHVTQERSEVVDDKTTTLGTSSYTVSFEVTDEEKDSYTIHWMYSDIQLPEAADWVKSLGQIMNGVTLVIKTDENGSFLSLENWQEIGQIVNRYLDELVKQFPDRKDLSSITENIKVAFSSKTFMESSGIKEVLQYLKFYGSQYEIDKSYQGDMSIQDPFGGPGFTATGSAIVKAADIDEKDDTFIVRQWADVDHDQAKKAIVTMLTKLTSGTAKPLPTDDELGDIVIQDRDTAQFEGSTGWLYTSIFTRELTYSGKRRLDRTTIELQ